MFEVRLTCNHQVFFLSLLTVGTAFAIFESHEFVGLSGIPATVPEVSCASSV